MITRQMKPSLTLTVALCIAVLPFFINSPAHSQSVTVDQASFMNRLDRIERRLMALEQKVFTAGGQAAAAAGQSAGSLSDYELRLQEIENESGSLYGAVEQLGNSVDKLATRLEKMAQDLEFRLQDLEKKAMEQPASMINPNDKDAMAAMIKGATPEKKRAIELPDSMKVPENLEPEKHYKMAYEYLVAEQYPIAQKWLKTFIERHKEHELADNAYYWLGEVHLVQGQNEEAIIAFKDGLTAFPKGRKAPGHLLKIGVAFDKMGQTRHAKSAWEKLVKDYPSSSEATKAKSFLGEGKPADQEPA